MNAKPLLNLTAALVAAGDPMVVAGDMNSWSGYASYPLFAQAGWINAYEAAVASGKTDSETAVKPGTSPGYIPSSYVYTENKRIDHIFFSGFSVAAFRNDYTRYYNSSEGFTRHPSDHIPVRVEFSQNEMYLPEEFGW